MSEQSDMAREGWERNPMSQPSKSKGTRVSVPGIGAGTIVNVRTDDTGLEIYTVNMDDPAATADGLLYAREAEFCQHRHAQHEGYMMRRCQQCGEIV